MSISRSIRRWQELDQRQRVWLAVFVAMLPLLQLSLRIRGFERTRALIERLTERAGQRQPSRRDLFAANDLAWLAQIAGRRGLLAATCLPQALAVYGAIRRRGLDPVLQIGVRKQQGRFEAHAWVELASLPLAQPVLDHMPLRLPDTGSNTEGP